MSFLRPAFMACGNWVLFSVGFAAAWAGDDEFTAAEVKRIIRTAIDQKLLDDEPPQIDFSKPGCLRVHFGNVADDDLVVKNWNETEQRWELTNQWRVFPLRSQWTIEHLRRSRSTPDQARNWKPYFDQAERAVERQVELIRKFERKMQELPPAPDPPPPDPSGPEPADPREALALDLYESLETLEGCVIGVLLSHLDKVAAENNLNLQCWEGPQDPKQRFKYMLVPDEDGFFRRDVLSQGSHDLVELVLVAPSIVTKVYVIQALHRLQRGNKKTGDPLRDGWQPLTPMVVGERQEFKLSAKGALHVWSIWEDGTQRVDDVNYLKQPGRGDTFFVNLTPRGAFFRPPPPQ
jgi:hypothetical protein